MSEERRQKLIELLKNTKTAITGSELSRYFKVSRQVIVQDIALIRAQGHEVLATASGYILPSREEKTNLIKRIVCKHVGYEEMEEELKTMVDMGVKVLDVMVDHPVYGKISKALRIGSRIDVEDFMENVRRDKAAPLATLTGGQHIHTIEIPNQRAFEKMIQSLQAKGYFIREL